MADDKTLLANYIKEHIPLVNHMDFDITDLTHNQCIITMPLTHMTMNHVKSMYFAVLAAGADLACGILAMQQIQQTGQNIVLVFKDFQADFLKRADDDVEFVCTSGEAIQHQIQACIETKQRQNQITIVNGRLKSDPSTIVFTAKLNLSMKLYPKDSK